MRRTASVVIVVTLLCAACVEQASAGGIAEFLFGSKPRMVQWFAPSCDGDLTARDPVTLKEMTFDLEGNGNRVVFDPGIPVERGLILFGTVCPKTGPNETFKGVSRLDGNGKMLEVVEGPRPDSDQERWLTHMVARARDIRGTPQFRGFQTTRAPYFFAIDTGLLAYGAHSVEVFVWVGKRTGASVVLPFRVVPLVDEDTGESQPTEYEDSRLGRLYGVTGGPPPRPPAPPRPPSYNPPAEMPAPPPAMNFPPTEQGNNGWQYRTAVQTLSDAGERYDLEQYEARCAGRTFDLSAGWKFYESNRPDHQQHVMVVVYSSDGRLVPSLELSTLTNGRERATIRHWRRDGVFFVYWQNPEVIVSTVQISLNGTPVATIRFREGSESAVFVPIFMDEGGYTSIGEQRCSSKLEIEDDK